MILKHTFVGYDKHIDHKLALLPFPAYRHKKTIVTFVERDELESALESRISLGRSLELRRPDFTSFGNERLNQSLQELRVALSRLLGLSWRTFLRNRRLPVYELSQRTSSFFFTTGLVERDKLFFKTAESEPKWRAVLGFKTIGTSTRGKRKRYWHFAVSLRPRFYPLFGYIMKPHVLFSDDGSSIWDDKNSLHRARRSQCKDWWNDDWRGRLLASISWLSNGKGEIILLDSFGARLTLCSEPVSSSSPITYVGDVVPDDNSASDPEGEDEDLLEGRDEDQESAE